MLRRAAFVLSLLLAIARSGAALAATPVPAVDISAPWNYTSTSARDGTSAGRIYLEFPSLIDGLPGGNILLPPQPGSGVLMLPCGCFHIDDVATGLNAGGRVLGRRIEYGSGGPFLGQLATWDASGTLMTMLAPLPGTLTYRGTARHLNAGEVIVGSILLMPPAAGVSAPVVWSSPTATPATLANLGTSAGPFPVRISNGGAIIGDRTGVTPRAVLWPSTASAFVYLGELPGGATSHAKDLDEGGRIVGSSDDGSGTQVAVLWRPSGGGHTVETLPIPFAGGSCQVATAIEAGKLIAGNCTTAGGDRRGVIWRILGGVVSVAHELLPLSSDTDSAVYGLAGSERALGSSGDPERAVLWELVPAQAIAVPSLGLPGLVLLVAAVSLGALHSSRVGRPFSARPRSDQG